MDMSFNSFKCFHVIEVRKNSLFFFLLYFYYCIISPTWSKKEAVANMSFKQPYLFTGDNTQFSLCALHQLDFINPSDIITFSDFKRKILTWTGVRISNLLAQVRIVLLKSEIVISESTSYNFVANYISPRYHQLVAEVWLTGMSPLEILSHVYYFYYYQVLYSHEQSIHSQRPKMSYLLPYLLPCFCFS